MDVFEDLFGEPLAETAEPILSDADNQAQQQQLQLQPHQSQTKKRKRSYDADAGNSSDASIRSDAPSNSAKRPKTSALSKKKVKKQAITEDDLNEQIMQLISRMKSANIGLERLRLLPEFFQILNNSHSIEVFIDQNGVSVMAQWLDLLEDGSLVNLTLREQLLTFLKERMLTLLSLESAKESSIGVILNDLFHHNKIELKQRTLIGEIMNDWVQRIIVKYTGNSKRK